MFSFVLGFAFYLNQWNYTTHSTLPCVLSQQWYAEDRIRMNLIFFLTRKAPKSQVGKWLSQDLGAGKQHVRV
jgi:hypothetical protein